MSAPTSEEFSTWMKNISDLMEYQGEISSEIMAVKSGVLQGIFITEWESLTDAVKFSIIRKLIKKYYDIKEKTDAKNI